MNKRNKNLVRTVALLVAAIMIVTTLIMGIPMVYGASGSRVYAAAADVVDEETLDEELDFMGRLIQGLREIYKDEISYETLVNGAYEGIFDALGDPYSQYFDTREESDELEEQVSGEFDGIGIVMESDDGRCKVVSPVANSPAEQAGIQSGDIILTVDGVNLTGKTMDEWKRLIRGEAGTQVTLTIQRGTTTLKVNVTRDRIRTDAVAWEMMEGNIAYVQIAQFDSDADKEFRKALTAVKEAGAEAMILDLRNNPGGYVNVAVNIANMLIPGEGKVIMEMTRQGESLGTIETTGAGSKFELPLVLLINEGSASASEIVAGALQDHGVATLVGTTTYGKGIAQSMTNLKNGGTMKVSTYYFTTPNGNTIHKVGISPDVCVINGSGLSTEEIAAEYAKLAPMTEKVKYYTGQTGLNVYAAQQRLNLLGEKLSLTGTMDEDTVAAVKKFQKEAGMCPYGGLDYGTMATLERYVMQYLSGETADLQMEKAVELLKK